jgi:hypothetical protein
MMTATLWIHRLSAADVLVRLPTPHDAYSLGARFLFTHQSPVEEANFISSWNESSYTTDEMFYVGDTPSLQLSVHPGEFHPEDDAYLGISEWSLGRILILTPEEAMALEPVLPGQLEALSQDDESVDEDWRQTQIERYRYGSDR